MSFSSLILSLIAWLDEHERIFFRALWKYFSFIDGTGPRRKIGSYPNVNCATRRTGCTAVAEIAD